MKKILFALLISQSVNAQSHMPLKSADLDMNWSHTGLSSTLDFRYHKPHYSFAIGLKFHCNTPINDNQQYQYKHRSYAQSFGEHWGIHGAVTRNINIANLAVTPFVSYDLLVSRIGIRYNYLAIDTMITYTQPPLQYDTVYIPAYHYYFEPPLFSFENYISVGLNIPLSERLMLTQAVGAGLTAYLRKQDNLHAKPAVFEFDPGLLFRMALRYTFKFREE